MKVKRYGAGPNPRQIYLIAPQHAPHVYSMKKIVEFCSAKTFMPNSALATLMALTPNDVSVEYQLCDENVEEIDWQTKCDLVAITGYTLHANRIKELCMNFKDRGVPVALGGAFATTLGLSCQKLADYLFLGEAEYTWPRFLREWCANKPSKQYIQKDFVDLKDSPAPDWSLIDLNNYQQLSVQTGRGCPHKCDFCDVIQLYGRRFRTKTIPQIMTELKNASTLGALRVFFSDDNFIGKKSFAKELLKNIIEWNAKLIHPISFLTQITMLVGDDEELLKMLADARFFELFLGMETIRQESLREVQKEQNFKQDPVERIQRISKYGIIPLVGLIVGFDHDDTSVFDDINLFLEQASVPLTVIGLLNAPKDTPLYERMSKAGRLIGDNFTGEWQLATNIKPLQFTLKELQTSYMELFHKVYSVESFERRMDKWLGQVEYHTPLYNGSKESFSWANFRSLLKMLCYGFSHDWKMRRMTLRYFYRAFCQDKKNRRRIFELLSVFYNFYDFTYDTQQSTRYLESR